MVVDQLELSHCLLTSQQCCCQQVSDCGSPPSVIVCVQGDYIEMDQTRTHTHRALCVCVYQFVVEVSWLINETGLFLMSVRTHKQPVYNIFDLLNLISLHVPNCPLIWLTVCWLAVSQTLSLLSVSCVSGFNGRAVTGSKRSLQMAMLW